MVICPIAIAVHCTGCPFVSFCPAKTILGDYKKSDPNNALGSKNTDPNNFGQSADKANDSESH